MRRDWRDSAKAYEAGLAKPRDPDAEAETVAELNHKLDEAVPIRDEQASLGEDGPDYIVIWRQMPTR
jgi:hypothetical protein